jgi:hypothetical protein
LIRVFEVAETAGGWAISVARQSDLKPEQTGCKQIGNPSKVSYTAGTFHENAKYRPL